MGFLNDIWHRQTPNKKKTPECEQVVTLQRENDALLDDIERLKLDMSELADENGRLSQRLKYWAYYRAVVRALVAVVVCMATYGLFVIVLKQPFWCVMGLLLVELAISFLMLKGDNR